MTQCLLEQSAGGTSRRLVAWIDAVEAMVGDPVAVEGHRGLWFVVESWRTLPADQVEWSYRRRASWNST